MSTTTELKSDWKWKQRSPAVAIDQELVQDSWQPAVSMPSEIHLELLHLGRIPDPFLGHNEHKIQCQYVSSMLRPVES